MKIRQTAPTLQGIREDHRKRYELVCKNHKGTVLDLGAGVGYGSYMMAEAGLKVFSYELDVEAFKYGNIYYAHHNVERHCANVVTTDLPETDFIAMFEFIEHITEAPEVLSKIKSGKLYASVPNEDVIPFATPGINAEHVRHYTPSEFRDLLKDCGWKNIKIGCQTGKKGVSASINWKMTNGRTLIAMAEK